MRNYQIMRYLLIVCWIIGNMPSGWAAEGGSTYTQRPDDPEAFYLPRRITASRLMESPTWPMHFKRQSIRWSAKRTLGYCFCRKEIIVLARRFKFPHPFGWLVMGRNGRWFIWEPIHPVSRLLKIIWYGLREGWHKRAGSLRMPVQVLSIVRCPMWISV